MTWQDYKDPYLFGLGDGLNGGTALIISSLFSNIAALLIFMFVFSRAISSMISMGGQEYLETRLDENQPTRIVSEKVAGMGAGYLTSALFPGLGFLIGLQFGKIWFMPMTILMLAVQIYARRVHGYKISVIVTSLIFAGAVGAGLLASYLFG